MAKALMARAARTPRRIPLVRKATPSLFGAGRRPIGKQNDGDSYTEDAPIGLAKRSSASSSGLLKRRPALVVGIVLPARHSGRETAIGSYESIQPPHTTTSPS